jgi:molecular chaperone IbpA|tara:strand:- start:1163 stop:1615 length:453 start_codon:yes stop_codon:yes gene_type:complete
MTKHFFNITDFPMFVGLDRVYDQMLKHSEELGKTVPNFPPYNIRKVDENKYTVEIAVAGFSKSDIEIEIDGDTLKITGNSKDDADNLLYKGIANRGFTRMFNLADTIEVQDASLVNGMLKVFLENIIPENKKPRKMDIKEEQDGTDQADH